MPHTYCTYVESEGEQLFTAVSLPDKDGTFPIVLARSPYVDELADMTEEELCDHYASAYAGWNAAGYAVVSQHCRGRGKSTGDCIPYIHEREDGLALQEWARHQPFYAGELYLNGGSYCGTVHYVTAPFASDIKGAVLEVQDQDRYNCNYRNGFYKMGLHGGWYVDMYKKQRAMRGELTKSYTPDCYKMLPLINFSQSVLGEKAEDFDAILMHPDRDDPFWKETRFGGAEAIGAINGANIPILLITGFYDIYTGGVFDMWKQLDAPTKTQSALIVHPYAHSGSKEHQPVEFPNGEVVEQFGDATRLWFDAIRGKADFPVETGKVTYYELYGNRWRTDDFAPPADTRVIPLGEGEHTYVYNPYAPASFRGGLSANFGGTAWQDPPNSRYDILSIYTAPFETDTVIKGQMTARLCVRSDCEDTCFYVRVSLAKADGDLGLRDDITAISGVAPDYNAGDEVMLDLTFDDHAFVVKAGEKLRVDISSSAFGLYVPHTNNRGHFALQTTAKIAHNTVVLDKSALTLPIE